MIVDIKKCQLCLKVNCECEPIEDEECEHELQRGIGGDIYCLYCPFEISLEPEDMPGSER